MKVTKLELSALNDGKWWCFEDDPEDAGGALGEDDGASEGGDCWIYIRSSKGSMKSRFL